MAKYQYQQIERQNIGKRVELHPATDAWMSGDRYGTIIKTTMRTANMLDPRDSAIVFVTVKLDKSGRTIRVHESNIRSIFGGFPSIA
jgi:hypothetical protein